MKKFLRALLPAALLPLAFACEFPFPLDDVSEAAIYINYLPSAPYDTPVLQVAFADPAYGKPSPGTRTPSVNDISVTLNGRKAELSSDSFSDGNMLTAILQDCSLRSGDKIEVSVRSDSAPTAYASTIIPPVPVLGSVTMDSVPEDSTQLRFKVKLDRSVQEGEFFGVRILEKNTLITASLMGEGILYKGTSPSAFPPMPVALQIDTNEYYTYKLPGQVATRDDLNSLDLDAFANADYNGYLTEEGINVTGPMMLLTHKQFDSDTYSFYVSRSSGFNWRILFPEGFEFPEPEMPDPVLPDEGETDPGEIDPMPPSVIVIMDNIDYVVEVYRLSEELYNYFKAQYLMRFNLLSNFGVTPPNFTYSNVSGGLGIVAGLSGVRTEWFHHPDNTEGKSIQEVLAELMSGIL